MPNLQAIRRRIGSVKSTQKITRAMKMVAAAKLRRAQEAVMRTRPYAAHMQDMTSQLLARAEVEEHPLMVPGKGNTIGLIVVTSDRGLCGGFNANIASTAIRAVKNDFPGRQVELIVIGRKGVDILRRRGVAIRSTYMGLFDKLSPNSSMRVMEDVVRDFTDGLLAEVYCLYSDFSTSLTPQIRMDRLLPCTPKQDPEAAVMDCIFEPSESEVLYALLVENVRVQLHRILHESVASEHGARMRAMDSATKNAGDVIARLTLNYNRARQDAITRQVVEVISAAEAL